MIHAWLALVWAVAVAFLAWETAGGPSVAGDWGLFATGVAMSATLATAFGRAVAMLRLAYDLGREEERAEGLVSVPDRR